MSIESKMKSLSGMYGCAQSMQILPINKRKQGWDPVIGVDSPALVLVQFKHMKILARVLAKRQISIVILNTKCLVLALVLLTRKKNMMKDAKQLPVLYLHRQSRNQDQAMKREKNPQARAAKRKMFFDEGDGSTGTEK